MLSYRECCLLIIPSVDALVIKKKKKNVNAWYQ